MANEAHLAILHQGVSAWNKWRKEASGIWPDLSGANLAKRNLSNIDFFRTNLNRADLTNTDCLLYTSPSPRDS